jgi:hypothetical protein
MLDDAALLEIKRRLVGDLMAIGGVAGVGIGEGSLRVYLERENEEARAAAHRVIGSKAPVEFIVSGEFRAQ